MNNGIAEIYHVRLWLEQAIQKSGGQVGTECGAGDMGDGPEADTQLVLDGKTYDIHITIG
jgi:hypothetical protein